MEPRDKAMDVLARLSGRDKGEIKPEMDLVADLEFDSPKALELLVELEETLGVEISDEDAAKLVTVGDILGYLERVPG